jgi:PAS domain S-box-containing protein
MFAFIFEIYNDFVLWEKILASIVTLGGSLFALSKVALFLWGHIKEANRTVTNFLKLIPELEKMTLEFKPNNGQSLFDILKRLENNLGYTDQKIKVIASCMGIAAFETDKYGLYTFVSKQWSEATGSSYDEAEGNGWLNAIDEENRNEVFKEWESCLKQNREFHCTAKLANQEDKEISIVAWPIRNLDGSVEKFFGILI